MLQQDVFRLQVAVNNFVLAQEVQGIQNLNGEPPNQLDGEPCEFVVFQQIVQIEAQQLKYQTLYHRGGHRSLMIV